MRAWTSWLRADRRTDHPVHASRRVLRGSLVGRVARGIGPGSWFDEDGAVAVGELRPAVDHLNGEMAGVDPPVVPAALCRPPGYADRVGVGGVMPEIDVGVVGIIRAV